MIAIKGTIEDINDNKVVSHIGTYIPLTTDILKTWFSSLDPAPSDTCNAWSILRPN